MRIIVDTNILFSAFISSKGMISDLLLNSRNVFDFYIPRYVYTELANHYEKLLTISKLTPDELDLAKTLLFKEISTIDEVAISYVSWMNAYELCEQLDANDTPFIALSMELQAVLWTGDKKQIKGLKESGFNDLITTTELKMLREKIERDDFSH